MTLILSLDDDVSNLGLIGLILEYAGYEHLGTDNDDEALSLLRSQPVDLFTQDVMRPKMDGLHFYQIMKSDDALCHIPVLFISACVRPEFAEECRSVYGDDYLNKPFSRVDLVTAAAALLTRHGKHVPTEEEQAAKLDYVRAKYLRHPPREE